MAAVMEEPTADACFQPGDDHQMLDERSSRASPEAFDGADDDDDVDDVASGLISFVNLENLVKHIIRKFKSLEVQQSAVTDNLDQFRKELDEKAASRDMDDLATELGQRIDSAKQLATEQKENLSQLGLRLERQRVASGAIEKKLEAFVKGKAVQDRLIREVQEGLQDKVAIAELNLFEAKFAGYCTKLELQEVMNDVATCARSEAVDSISRSVRHLETRFHEYARTAKIDMQLQEVREWVTEELAGYAPLAKTNDRIEGLQQRIEAQTVSFERAHAASSDQARALSDRLTSIYTELQNDVRKALEGFADLKKVKDSLNKFAIKAETDAFQQDVQPKLRFCMERIRTFDEKVRVQDDAIQRVDEILLDKAAKFDVSVVSQRIDDCIQKDAATAEFHNLQDSIARLATELSDYKGDEAVRMEKWRPPDYGPKIADLTTRCDQKADRADLVEMYQLKANRVDADEIAKLQETIHRQLEYLAVTTLGLSKLALTEAKSSESKTMRAQQKSQVLMQSESLWNWILHNEDPPNLDALRPPPGRSAKAGVTDKMASTTLAHGDGAKKAQIEQRLGVTFS
jgi:uncharacterized phage infection (PIP) family protein YhgE